jgi:Raf kinase inhibitor-like YbhB/YbcL family protein
MDDPDAPRGTFTHWLACDIPVGAHELNTSAGRTLANGFGRQGYGGPCPPPGHGVHRYFFTVYALDVAALDVRGTARKDLEAALKGHMLGEARLMGRYERAKR